MSTFLFATLDAGGNVPPALLIGGALVRQGHSVRFLGHGRQADAVRAMGAAFTPYRPSVPEVPTVEVPALRDLVNWYSVLTARGIADDLLAEARRITPDLVVLDCLLLGALRAAAREGLAYVSLEHSFHAYFEGPFLRDPVAKLARLRGMGPQRGTKHARLVLVCADPALDPAGGNGTARHVVWAGAAVDVPAPAVPPTHPHVLVSLSTLAYPGQPAVLQRILDAVADLPVDVTLTTGPAVDPAALSAPPNADVHRHVPHNDVMRRCSAVIGHGGHATTMRALAHGLPMLILPMSPVLDQPMIGEAVQRAGAGRVLDRESSGTDIAGALMDILTIGSYAEAAASLGARLRAADGTGHGARLLEDLVRPARA